MKSEFSSDPEDSVGKTQQHDLLALKGEDLNDEKTRYEIRKLRLEVQESSSWRTRFWVTLFLSILVPVGGIITFTNAWFGAHASERKHVNDDLYNRAAEQLSSKDASVRLNEVITIETLMHAHKPRFIRGTLNRIIGKNDSELSQERNRESMALLIGRLSSETDQAVLDQIASTASKNPADAIQPLLSVNRSAAVHFARASGDFSASYILRNGHKTSMSEDDPRYKPATEGAITAINIVTLRTGSPFEAKNAKNGVFASIDFFEQRICPFRELFLKEQSLNLSSGFRSALLDRPPTTKVVVQNLDKMAETASVLEKSSYVLGRLADDEKTWGEAWAQHEKAGEDLYGVAVVVGEFKSSTVNRLRALGAYVEQPEENKNPGCVIPQSRTK